MVRGLYCHRHRAQEEAYFLRKHPPWTKAQVLSHLAEKALLNCDMEDAGYDVEAGTLSVKDWCGATFVLTLTKHIKALPFKQRLAAALSATADEDDD